MRRTRHVVLPVRSWQYIGLLIVSLACLTLGLVSRDREGHSGNLAGPELTHRAPHEVDACPNLNPFTKSPIAEKLEEPINDHEMKTSESRMSSQKPVISRSLSLDRLSRSGSREIRERLSGNRDLRTVERLSRSRTRVSDDRSGDRFRESRFRIAQSRDLKSSSDPITRLSRSRDLFSGATDRHSANQNFERRLTDRFANSRLEDRRSRSTERRKLNEIERRQNPVAQSADRRDSLNLQRRTNDHRERKSLSTERRVDRQESREVLAGRREYRTRVPNHRSEIREHRYRFAERRMSTERRDAEQSDRREDRKDLLNRSARFARRDTDRNNNLDRRNRERSLENRRALHDRVADQEHGSRFSITRDSRREFIRSDNRRTLSRSMEHPGVNDLNRETLNRRVRSIEFSPERSDERRLSVRSIERREIDHGERRRIENRFADRKSLDRAMPRVSEDSRRERISRLQKTANRRNSRENAATEENNRMVSRSRYDVEKIASREQRERRARSSRSVDRNSVDRREIARTKDSRDYDRRSREERRIVLQRSREAERRTSEQRVPERQILERRDLVLDARRIDSAKSREGLVDRRLERNPESRVSRGAMLERRSAFDLRRSSERRFHDSSKSREEFKLADRRSERSSELRVSRGRMLEGRSALDLRRSSERRFHDSSKSREGLKLADRRSERSSELRVSRGRMLEGRSALDLRRSSERRIHDGSREASRMQDRGIERNSELRNSISMLPTERTANSRTASLENRILRSSETQREIRRLTERRVVRSVENRPTELYERESIRRQRSARNIEEPSRLSSLRRVTHVPKRNREQRRLSAERMLTRTIDNERLSAKWERNLQDARIEKNMEARGKIVPNSIKDYEFFKYPMTYDIMRQAFVMALCTVYGLSLYNGKKSFIGNVMQRAQRFVIW